MNDNHFIIPYYIQLYIHIIQKIFDGLICRQLSFFIQLIFFSIYQIKKSYLEFRNKK